MRKMLIYSLGFILLLVVAGAIYFRTAEPELTKIDFATLQKKPSPNQFLVAPPGLTQTAPDMEAPTFKHSPEELRAIWRERVSRQSNVTLLSSDDALMQDDYRQRTPLMGYPDTVTVRFLPHESGSTLAVYSRSHFGHSDLGANEKRVREWLALLD